MEGIFFFFEGERFVVWMFPREEEVGIGWSILDFFFDYFLFENGGSVEDSDLSRGFFGYFSFII